jgi:tyrosyl-tRNA synthetase
MYGKVMSISDEMMWRYYELLTDLQVAEIEKKREAHPMQAKKELARRIVADFHSAEAARKAGEDWEKQFQKKEVPEDLEEVPVKAADVLAKPDGTTHDRIAEVGESGEFRIKLDRLLVAIGLADSVSDAVRKIKQRAVKVNGELKTEPLILLETRKGASVRVGKRAKRVRFIM